VRVDIYYGSATPRGKARVDLFGSLRLLLPMSTAIFVLAFPYVTSSWRVLEGSPEGQNGIPGVFLLKTMILAFAVLVGLQGLSLAVKSWMVLTGRTPPPTEAEAGGQV